MRRSLTLGFLGLSLFFGGCRSSEPAKTGGEGADYAAEGGDGVTTGNNQGGNTRTTGNPSGPPVVNYPGFEVLNDGRSVITVQVRGPFQVAEQKAEGRIIYVLTGVAVPEKVNRLPLVTQHFPTQVSSLTVEQTPGGANLLIDLRESSSSTFKVAANEAGSLLTITLPRSARWGTTNPENDPTNFERPTGAGGDVVDMTTAEGAPEDYEKETERRQRRSKRQARPYLWRAITLPYRTLAPDLAVSLAGYDVEDPFIFISSGIRYGIINEVEVELTPHTIRAAPNAAYAYPNLGITAGYFGENQTFEIGGRLRYFLGIDSDRSDVFDAGALLIGSPMAIHLGKWGRIDTGAYATLDFGGSLNAGVDIPGTTTSGDFRAALVNTHAVPFYVDSGIPFHFLFQVTDIFWFGIHHGISIFDLSNASETFALPLGAEMGITASDDFNPTADLVVRADLPQFILPGRDGDVVEENAYQLGVWFRWFYHL